MRPHRPPRPSGAPSRRRPARRPFGGGRRGTWGASGCRVVTHRPGWASGCTLCQRGHSPEPPDGSPTPAAYMINTAIDRKGVHKHVYVRSLYVMRAMARLWLQLWLVRSIVQFTKTAQWIFYDLAAHEPMTWRKPTVAETQIQSKLNPKGSQSSLLRPH